METLHETRKKPYIFSPVFMLADFMAGSRLGWKKKS